MSHTSRSGKPHIPDWFYRVPRGGGEPRRDPSQELWPGARAGGCRATWALVEPRLSEMSSSNSSRVVEDYLTLIWKAAEWPEDDRRATTTELAAPLGVTPSTVSANLRKLSRDGLIKYEPYGAIELTERGEAIAIDVVRRHRIIETYLVKRLGLTWDQVHDEADLLEHAVSELVLERMDEVLGHPQSDPHGDPIPRRGWQRSERDRTVLLSQASAGMSSRADLGPVAGHSEAAG